MTAKTVQRYMPKPGAMVRDPRTKIPVPAEGAHVPRTTFYIRRIACGDLIPAPALPVPAEPIQ